VHPVVERAAEGVLPEWSVVVLRRRDHMGRVADLLGSWAEALDAGPEERVRWRAVGILHDVLRDEDPDVLRERVPVSLRDLPGELLHGPAASERLRVDGVMDGELLRAVAFHTVGDRAFRGLGRALYAADFLEPGRSFRVEWRAALRARMPAELDEVVSEIAGARIANLLDRGARLHPRTIEFWNCLVADGS
jgi:HD superfamily phosphohydrolase YqeK